VPLQYFNGTAWVDYVPGSQVAIPASGTTLLVRTAIVNDSIYEAEETFSLLATSANGTVSSGIATIIDDGTEVVYDPNGDPTTETPDDDRPKPLPPPAPPIVVQPDLVVVQPPIPQQQPFLPVEPPPRIPEAPIELPSLSLAERIPDQFSEPNAPARFAIPEGTFISSRPGERLSLAAVRADGQPLPSWLSFNGTTGVFDGTPPQGFIGELQIKVIARDSTGNEVEAMFRFNIGDKREIKTVAPSQPAAPAATEQAAPVREPVQSQPIQDGPLQDPVQVQEAGLEADPESGQQSGPNGGSTGEKLAARPLKGRLSLQEQLRDQSQRVRPSIAAARATGVAPRA
jgi:hypothetical protein